MFFMFFVVLSIYVDVFLVEHLPIFNATQNVPYWIIHQMFLQRLIKN